MGDQIKKGNFIILLIIMLILSTSVEVLALEKTVDSQELDEKSKDKQIKSFKKENKELLDKTKKLSDENIRLKRDNKRLNSIINQGRAREIPVLLYHHIYEDSEAANWEGNLSALPLSNFKEQMKYLYENKYYTATIDELSLFMDGLIDLPKNTVVISFDDGYKSNIDLAYPIMKEYEQYSTIFIRGFNTEDAINKGKNSHIINKEDMAASSDYIDYQSHTYDLHHLDGNNKSKLYNLEDMTKIEADFIEMRNKYKMKHLAYPFGHYNDEVIGLSKFYGYKTGFTIDRGLVTRQTDKFKIPRNSVYPNMTLEDFKNILSSDQDENLDKK